MKHTDPSALYRSLEIAIDALLDRASDYLDDDDLDSVEDARNDEEAADILQSLHTAIQQGDIDLAAPRTVSDEFQVYDWRETSVEAGNHNWPDGWVAVTSDEGIVAYFGSEDQAAAFCRHMNRGGH